VTLATAEPVYRLIASAFSDATYIPLPANRDGELGQKPFTDELEEAIGNASSLLIGSGLGQSAGAGRLVREVVFDQAIRTPVVLDADCLNLLSRQDGWHSRIPAQAVLTPHPGEMARLTCRTVGEIQDDRLGSAVSAASRWNAVVVLKGACTVIADPDGNARIIPFANSGLATAGTGDVLAGVITGLLAQGLETYDAATLGAYLHGRAGESAREWHGEASMLASDLLAELSNAYEAIGP
jgi:NAD(P)H-hydrate epimerase